MRYHARGRTLLAVEGGCTALGWHARVQAQRLTGVRALSMAIGWALVDDLDRLADLGPALDQQLPKDGPARQVLEAFQLGLERLVGLIALLADTRRVVHCTTPDGRRVVDLFRLTETGRPGPHIGAAAAGSRPGSLCRALTAYETARALIR